MQRWSAGERMKQNQGSEFSVGAVWFLQSMLLLSTIPEEPSEHSHYKAMISPHIASFTGLYASQHMEHDSAPCVYIYIQLFAITKDNFKLF